MDDDELAAAEEARDRRRDRRSEAHERDLMRTGSAKVFKQILDAQEKRARDERADERVDERADEDTDGRPRHGRHRHHGHGDDRER